MKFFLPRFFTSITMYFSFSVDFTLLKGTTSSYFTIAFFSFSNSTCSGLKSGWYLVTLVGASLNRKAAH
jgi:hypothetical protein